MSFAGAKLLLRSGGEVLTYLRDDKPDLLWADKWDLPGGGREGRESPEACVLRELEEELGLRLDPERLLWRRAFPGVDAPGTTGWFFVGRTTSDEIAEIRFGDEGQFWRMMPLGDWLAHPDAIPALQARSRIALGELGLI